MQKDNWPLDRVLYLLAGGGISVSLLLGKKFSRKWHLLTALIGANLILKGATGWCPVTAVLLKADFSEQCAKK